MKKKKRRKNIKQKLNKRALKMKKIRVIMFKYQRLIFNKKNNNQIQYNWKIKRKNKNKKLLLKIKQYN